MDLDRRLAELILRGSPFTADDLTEAGALAVDGGHGANGAQSAIGSRFAQASRAGRIRFTGRVVQSTAPHRKGGIVRVWEATPAGLSWATALLEPA